MTAQSEYIVVDAGPGIGALINALRHAFGPDVWMTVEFGLKREEALGAQEPSTRFIAQVIGLGYKSNQPGDFNLKLNILPDDIMPDGAYAEGVYDAHKRRGNFWITPA